VASRLTAEGAVVLIADRDAATGQDTAQQLSLSRPPLCRWVGLDKVVVAVESLRYKVIT
jgi:hypothetical protein